MKTVGSFKLRVQAPCSQPWGSMAGDDRARHCTRCELRVHNLSAMCREDALKLITGPDERLCLRFDTHLDGSVITGGRASGIRRSLRVVGLIVAAIGFWAAMVLVQLPWLAIARRMSQPAARQATADDARAAAARAELERRLEAIQATLNDRHTMGAISNGERERIRAEAEYERRRHANKPR